MFLTLWSWIRRRTSEAVLAGIGDAIGQLDGSGEDGTADAAAALLTRLRALPSPSEEEAVGGRKRK
jgi:hypothetical protein